MLKGKIRIRNQKGPGLKESAEKIVSIMDQLSGEEHLKGSSTVKGFGAVLIVLLVCATNTGII